MKKIESGRSMIEMLGVLAIIGVLSIGGLAGYTMAMNRYRASNLSDYVSRCVVVAQTKTMTGRIGTGDAAKCSKILGEDAPGWLTGANAAANEVTLTEDEDSGEIYTTVGTVPDAVDQVLKDRFNTNSARTDSDNIGGVKYTTKGKFIFLGSAVS